jgi:hypothetical protein
LSAGNDNPWTSLEVVKIISSSLTPLVVAGVGIYIYRLSKRFEHLQWRNQKLVEKRLSIYDDIAPLLNDNLCYFTYVGTWKTKTPPEVIASKRKLGYPIENIEGWDTLKFAGVIGNQGYS